MDAIIAALVKEEEGRDPEPNAVVGPHAGGGGGDDD